jgi:hypothetical protein
LLLAVRVGNGTISGNGDIANRSRVVVHAR